MDNILWSCVAILIDEEKFEYELIRCNRKSLCAEVTRELKIVIRVPKKCRINTVADFIESHKEWLIKALERQKARNERMPEPDENEIKRLKALAKAVIPPKVQYYSSIMSLHPVGVKITSAKTRLGSCSASNSLCFSYRLMQYPEEVIDYVVVHELAHIKHHDHSKNFYGLIEKYMPDYKERVKIIKQ